MVDSSGNFVAPGIGVLRPEKSRLQRRLWHDGFRPHFHDQEAAFVGNRSTWQLVRLSTALIPATLSMKRTVTSRQIALRFLHGIDNKPARHRLFFDLFFDAGGKALFAGIVCFRVDKPNRRQPQSGIEIGFKLGFHVCRSWNSQSAQRMVELTVIPIALPLGPVPC
jgi:hypothetical protein